MDGERETVGGERMKEQWKPEEYKSHSKGANEQEWETPLQH